MKRATSHISAGGAAKQRFLAIIGLILASLLLLTETVFLSGFFSLEWSGCN